MSACIDELTVTVASMTHQRFAAGHYDIASDGDAVSFRLTCDITSDGGTCKNDGSTTATLRETGDEILVEVPAAPRTLNVSVSKDGTELVRTELLPSYATTTSCTGSCQSASSRIVVPE